jgi:hypothetical protein
LPAEFVREWARISPAFSEVLCQRWIYATTLVELWMLRVELIETVVEDVLREGGLVLAHLWLLVVAAKPDNVPTTGNRRSLERDMCECTDSVLSG